MDKVYYEVSELTHRYQIDRSTLYRWMEENGYPRQLNFSGGKALWKAKEVHAWEAKKHEESANGQA